MSISSLINTSMSIKFSIRLLKQILQPVYKFKKKLKIMNVYRKLLSHYRDRRVQRAMYSTASDLDGLAPSETRPRFSRTSGEARSYLWVEFPTSFSSSPADGRKINLYA
jgi:hypothetical protein